MIGDTLLNDGILHQRAVGHACTQALQETQSLSELIRARFDAGLKPRPSIVSAKRALNVFAGTNASGTDNAFTRVVGEIGVGRVFFLGVEETACTVPRRPTRPATSWSSHPH